MTSCLVELPAKNSVGEPVLAAPALAAIAEAGHM
jgi:hypothetical protein